MKKGTMIAGGFALAALIGGFTYYNAVQNARSDQHQRETDEKLRDLQKQLSQQTSGLPAAPAPSSPFIAGGANDSFTQKQALARQVIEEGFNSLNTRDPKKVTDAVRIFQEGIDKVDPENPQFYNGLGRSLLVLGKYRDSLAAFEKGEKLDPKNSDLVSGQGWDYWNLKNYPAAKDKWEQALKVNPKSLDALSAMAWVYLGLKERDKSLAAFNILIFESGMDRADWKNGRNMAAASNTDIQQISHYFPMPDPSAFTPPATAPTTLPH